jgi:transcriptional regulator with XRE-family HTH domain
MIRLKSVLAMNIKARRKALGLTQEKLAEGVNTASTYITMIESERRTPSFTMIERIAKVLQIEATELFSAKNYPSETAPQLHEELMNRFDKFLRAAVKDSVEDSLENIQKYCKNEEIESTTSSPPNTARPIAAENFPKTHENEP